MSQENVEIIRRYYEAPLPATLDQWAAFVERFWEADGDYYPVRSFPEAAPCHGRDEISSFFCDYFRHGRLIRSEDHVTAKGALRALGLSGDSLDAARLRE